MGRILSRAIAPYWAALIALDLLNGMAATGPGAPWLESLRGLVGPSVGMHGLALLLALPCYALALRLDRTARSFAAACLGRALTVALFVALLLAAGFVASLAGLAAPAASPALGVGWAIKYLIGLALIVGLRAEAARRAAAREFAAAGRRQATSRLGALRTRLGAHFLLNSVNTLLALVRRDSSRAENLVAELNELLRDMLRTDRPAFRRLTDELDFVSRYLYIEQVRFEGRIRVEYALEPQAREMPVPSGILQPLVENAVRHGLGSVTGAVHIRIEARRVDEALEFAIVNNCGSSPPAHGTGTGLASVRDQLATLFPERHSFEAGLQGDGSWRAALRIPVATSAEP